MKRFSLKLLTPLLLFPGLAGSGLAHNVEVGQDVAATMHIEPDHNPRSGEPALTWFALTRRGGELIPLEQCNCQLQVYQSGQSSPAVLTPPLTPVNAEKYRGIPGSEIVFPRSGQYILELKGSPKKPGQFQPFQFRYPVTVLTGTPSPQPGSPSPPSPDQPTATAPTNQSGFLWITLAIPLALGLAIGGFFWSRRKG